MPPDPDNIAAAYADAFAGETVAVAKDMMGQLLATFAEKDATIAAQAEAIRLLRKALAPVDADAAERVSFWEDDWNPEYHVNVTLTVAECRAIRNALAATAPKETSDAE